MRSIVIALFIPIYATHSFQYTPNSNLDVSNHDPNFNIILRLSGKNNHKAFNLQLPLLQRPQTALKQSNDSDLNNIYYRHPVKNHKARRARKRNQVTSLYGIDRVNNRHISYYKNDDERMQRPKKQSKNKMESNFDRRISQRNHKNTNRNVEKKQLDHAIKVESHVEISLQELESVIASVSSTISSSLDDKGTSLNNTTIPTTMIIFPTARECNSAMATFGDNNEFLRALRVFVKMRKSVNLHQKLKRIYSERMGKEEQTISTSPKKNRVFVQPSAPTLVTYSTLMSRAVQLGKPRVALRLWSLMTMQSNFFPAQNQQQQLNTASDPSTKTKAQRLSTSSLETKKMISNQPPIIPDVRAVNILMNAYAKLADVHSCQYILTRMLGNNKYENYYQNKEQESVYFSNRNTNTNPRDTDSLTIATETISIIPKMKPNIVTFNTLIDACQRAGELEHALQIRDLMKTYGIEPDIRTYTSLISAVARKGSKSYGAHDPDMGFFLLEEMKENNLRPNGMTYCALIDVCKRCHRSDLALRVLRMMLRQNTDAPSGQKPMDNEVGAWTAAIDACGKEGRMDTAMRLFRNMCSPKFSHLKPNMVTCCSIMDGLFKEKLLNMDNVVEVLKYMKGEGLEPTEVMYTSLISSAGRLVKAENSYNGRKESSLDETRQSIKKNGSTSAIDVYTELMGTLMRTEIESLPSKRDVTSFPLQNENTLLLKVFLVYQEMKAAGAVADLALYNALLKACASAGDVERAKSVMSTIYENGLYPNSGTWREMLRAAANSQAGGTLVEELWQLAWKGKIMNTSGTSTTKIDRQSSKNDYRWVPNIEAFNSLVTGYLHQVSIETDAKIRKKILEKVILLYKKILQHNELKDIDETWGFHYIKLEELHKNQRVMMNVLRAAVTLELMNTPPIHNSPSTEKKIAINIARLKCFNERVQPTGSPNEKKNTKALELAKIWSDVS